MKVDRKVLREMIREELLKEGKHVTNLSSQFREWFPEISQQFFNNIKFEYIEIGSRNKLGKVVFRFNNPKKIDTKQTSIFQTPRGRGHE